MYVPLPYALLAYFHGASFTQVLPQEMVKQHNKLKELEKEKEDLLKVLEDQQIQRMGRRALMRGDWKKKKVPSSFL